MPVRSIALLLAWGAAECVQAHPHCWTDERAVDLDDQLEFCSSNDDAEAGVCCTDAEEEAVLAKFEAAGSLTADCGDLYKQGELMIIDAFNGVYYLPCGDVCLVNGPSPTPEPSTPQPSTPELFAPQPSTPELSTPQPSTPELSTPQPASVSESTPAPVEVVYTYLGCFVDSSDRALSELALTGSSEMTTELCAEACAGWTYFGTEYGSECFCGDSGDTPEDLDSAVCDSQCAGQSDEICGGYWSVSVYKFTRDAAGVAVAAEDSQDDSSATRHSPSSAFVGLRAPLVFSISAVFIVSWLV